ncbi:MAG: hypothetical protein HRU15_08700, partial [Planctomycetes bacterium]|nr:hypothetical protein [Planctomycetota bacterium]
MTSGAVNWKEDVHAALSAASEHPELVALVLSDCLLDEFHELTHVYPEWTWLSSPMYVVARACGACIRDPMQQVFAAIWAEESTLAQWQDDLRLLQTLGHEK